MLTLRIIEGRGRGQSRTIGRTDFVIGRAPTCDWVLPGADRYVSNRHCCIAWVNGHHVLTDTSKNGVIHNDGGQPIGRDHSVFLADGDRLRLGDYVMAVSIEPEPKDDIPFQAAPLEVAPLAVAPLDHIDRDAADPGRSPIPGSASGLGLSPAWWEEVETAPAGSGEGPQVPVEPIWPDEDAPPESLDDAPPQDRDEDRPWVADMAGGDLLRVFLDAAGLDPSSLDGAEPAAILQVAGLVFRQTVEGLQSLLAVRGSLKREFRIDGTRIGPRDNNALKHAATADQAALQLLRPDPGYLPGDAAVRQAFRDLQQHELATSVGMQAALAALLRRFDPEALKLRLDRQSVLAGLIPATRRARYWELYEGFYQEIAAEAESDFHALFGKAFAEAYARQIQALAGAGAPAASASPDHEESR